MAKIRVGDARAPAAVVAAAAGTDADAAAAVTNAARPRRIEVGSGLWYDDASTGSVLSVPAAPSAGEREGVVQEGPPFVRRDLEILGVVMVMVVVVVVAVVVDLIPEVAFEDVVFKGVDLEGVGLEEIVRGAGLGVTDVTAVTTAEEVEAPRRDLSALCDRAEGRIPEFGMVVEELLAPPLPREVGGLGAGDNDTERLAMARAGPSGDSKAFGGGERDSSAILCPRLRTLQLPRSAPTASRFVTVILLLLLLLLLFAAPGPELELTPPPPPIPVPVAEETDPVRMSVMPSILKEPLQ